MRRLVSVLVLFASSIAFSRAEIRPLDILESYTVPTTEISGLAWRKNPKTKHRELLVVGDREHKLFIIDWDERKTKFAPREVDVKPLEGSAASSGWESVFSDETGRIFIITEDPARILIISADLTKVEGTITLKTPTDKATAEAWIQDPNSRGEGLLPLKNGHILVVKEKRPLQVIEYGPENAKAEGYNSKLSIEYGGTFPIPADSAVQFKPLFTWSFDEPSEKLMEDSSGLNGDAKGALYLLSDQRRWIASIGKNLKNNKERLKIRNFWLMPADIEKPEGMVIDLANRPIIAIDSKKTNKPNLFVLSAIE